MTMKRKNDTPTENDRSKKPRLSEEEDGQTTSTKPQPATPGSQNNTEKAHTNAEASSSNPDSNKKKRIRKLTPARPWPIVPTSVSATGPRSAHKEGKNLICISRKTGLGTYMRRCKDVIIKDGYKSLHLSAMGAAIPLLVQLTCALPPILPYAKDEIKTEVTTQTCDVQDEVLPDDDKEDVSIRTRSKSTLRMVITIGDGKFEGDTSGPLHKAGKNANQRAGKDGGKGKEKASQALELVYTEPDQDELMDML